MQSRFALALLLCWLLWLNISPESASAAISSERVATGVSLPVFVTAPTGDTERLFIIEQQTGRIEIMDLATDTISATPFLTVSDLDTGFFEQGLLGMAFDPDYANNGYFYVNLTSSSGNGDTHIRRYQVQGDPATSNVADPTSGLNILTFDQPQDNHNGGWIGFSPNDPDNLYIATGDGGGSDDNDAGHTAGTGNAQDITNNRLGKMLRINPSRDEEPTTLYTIPEDNPLVGVTGDDEIWAYGLRNPFRASFDRQSGDLWIGDVGQVAREEINFQPADSAGGENYGWRLREGTIATPSGGVGGARPPGNVDPVYDYTRGSGAFQGNVVIGGYVYRGPVPEVVGHYFFADNGSNNIWKLDPHAVDIPASVTNINSALTPPRGSINSIGSFGEDDAGNLYIVEVGGGEIYRIVSDSQDAVWDGNAEIGVPGNGDFWNLAENWSRGGTPDTNFESGDNVIFAAGSTVETVNLGADRTVAAIRFEAPFTLQNNQLQVLSGNVWVDEGVTATIESDLVAESNNHSIRKLGEGTLLVEGNAGQTAVLAGTLGGNGTLDHLTVKNGATVAPGTSPGTLNVTGSFTLQSGTLEIEIGGTEPGTEYDRILVDGTASLEGGTLAVSLVDLGTGQYEPGAGDTFAILVANGGFDTFGATMLPDLEPGLEWIVNPGGATMSLDVEIGMPGDYNLDGIVNAADYVVWRNTEGNAVVRGSFADGDADGMINDGDYLVWVENFGDTQAGGGAAVPEPTAVLLALCGMASLMVHRRTAH
jgi:glucose/arabinose dehydrogenase